MSEIGWGDLPEARQLARLGKRLSRAAQGRLQWTKCGADLPPFRDQPTDILSLEAALRPPRRDDLGRALASAAPRAPAHLGTGVGRTRFVSAQAVSALGQGQAGCAPRPREVQRLHLHGGTHPGLLEAARGASRTAQVGPAAAGAAKIAKTAMGHSQA